MESTELRKARFLVFIDKYWAAFMAAGFLVVGLSLGAYGNSYYSRVERMALMKQHDDEVRDFRMSCRRTVNERDEQVTKATRAAAEAAEAAANAANAAADDTPPPSRPAPKPATRQRAAPPDLNAMVREANRRIEEAK